MEAMLKVEAGTSNKIVHFGMKLTPEERHKIAVLSRLEGRPAKKVIMMLVQKALQKREKKLSAKDVMKLPPGERRITMAKQFQEAEKLYKDTAVPL
ncbi:MAG: hypothetical protein QME81_19750 [bacterium]|nr:hypothetical protein [bacterium]